MQIRKGKTLKLRYRGIGSLHVVSVGTYGPAGVTKAVDPMLSLRSHGLSYTWPTILVYA